MSLNIVFVERTLEQFVIGNIFVTRLGTPIDTAHGDGVGEDVFGELTCHGARGRLFDFGEIQIEEGVEEGEEFVTGCEVGPVHHS